MSSKIDAQQRAVDAVLRLFDLDAASRPMEMCIDAVEPGRVSISMTIQEPTVNGQGLCHSGIIFSLADSAIAFACISCDQAAKTVSSNIDFIRPAYQGDRLIADASTLHQGTNSSIYGAYIEHQRDEPIAFFKGTIVSKK